MPIVIPEACELEDEKLLFLSDVLPNYAEDVPWGIVP